MKKAQDKAPAWFGMTLIMGYIDIIHYFASSSIMAKRNHRG
jgi:hypothetical protein